VATRAAAPDGASAHEQTALYRLVAGIARPLVRVFIGLKNQTLAWRWPFGSGQLDPRDVMSHG
jgi:hypothetical protein